MFASSFQKSMPGCSTQRCCHPPLCSGPATYG